MILEIIQSISSHLVWTYNKKVAYIDKVGPCMFILAAREFVTFYTENRLKYYIPGQFIFGRYMIIPIKPNTDLKFIRQQNQA